MSQTNDNHARNATQAKYEHTTEHPSPLTPQPHTHTPLVGSTYSPTASGMMMTSVLWMGKALGKNGAISISALTTDWLACTAFLTASAPSVARSVRGARARATLGSEGPRRDARVAMASIRSTHMTTEGPLKVNMRRQKGEFCQYMGRCWPGIREKDSVSVCVCVWLCEKRVNLWQRTKEEAGWHVECGSQMTERNKRCAGLACEKKCLRCGEMVEMGVPLHALRRNKSAEKQSHMT